MSTVTAPALTKYRCTSEEHGSTPSPTSTLESDNPYTGQPWALIPRGTAADADRAVQAARRGIYIR